MHFSVARIRAFAKDRGSHERCGTSLRAASFKCILLHKHSCVMAARLGSCPILKG